MNNYGPDFDQWAAEVKAEVIPKIAQSSCTISLVPDEIDIKFALELGASVMLDKPIIALVQPGAKVPAKLVAVADRIVEFDKHDPTNASWQRVAAAIDDLLPEQ